MDWIVRPEEVTFLQTLEVFTQIMPHYTHSAFEYEDEDGDRITVRSDTEMKNMFEYYFSELEDEDRARGLFPPLIIYPKQGKTPQNRNIHGLKIRTGSQAEDQSQPVRTKPQTDLEGLLSCGNFTKESLQDVILLGQGNGGRVYRAIHKPTSRVIAVKEIQLDISVNVQKQIISELEILYKCNSRMIISFFGAFFLDNCISICTEYMDGGSLDRFMPMSEQILWHVSVCVIEGMQYLWNLKILHRDIKPYNILVNTSGEIKLCDFGVSTQLVKSIATTYLGTNVYMAPERVQGHDYGKPAEVWSFGVTLFELATGHLPFGRLNSVREKTTTSPNLQPFEIMKVIVEEPQLSLPTDKFSAQLVNYVDQCLNKSPSKRLLPQDLTAHPFMLSQQNFDSGLISQLVLSKGAIS